MQRCDIFLIKGLTDVNPKELLETRLWGISRRSKITLGTEQGIFSRKNKGGRNYEYRN
ncbi:hypothetical protein [Butyrivibrio sp. TB]|uniref:hypothetical protein n=1 Tax=Butyrivibrio sp. TB TaxID=1520809 RepID=UPI0008CF6A19|nr:hypothetical protein [Butyrivibrio sp. TB]SEP76885.1 hypothetical protein SAMN02910382_00965 [Butyrivibrio sp. TB]